MAGMQSIFLFLLYHIRIVINVGVIANPALLLAQGNGGRKGEVNHNMQNQAAHWDQDVMFIICIP